MKHLLSASAILAVTTSLASAGGLDRSGQPIGIIFEDGNYAELSFGHTTPSVDGVDLATSGPTGEVAGEFLTVGFGMKYQFSEQVSFALIIDEPYGSDVSYPVTATSPLLGGTGATVDSYAVTGIGRYKFNENYSVHGGIRYQEISASVDLSGLVFGGLSGYNAQFASSGDFGYVIGAAYEIPDIALRVALTYNSKITHNLATQETIGGAAVAPLGSTEVVTPESINLDFQSGIAANTLLFGSIRHAKFSQTITSPVVFDSQVDPATPGSSLTNIEDSTDFTLGVGYKFSEKWSGSAAIGYSTTGVDNLVSPLAPTNGNRSLTLGARYTHNNMIISGGVRYTDLGDAFAETGTPDTARANFSGNSAVSVGVKVGFKF